MQRKLFGARRPGGPTAALAALAFCAFCAAPARADRVEGSRSELLREQSHFIDIRIDRGIAKLVVRRTVHNGGPRHDQATFWIDMPSGAVATGLRTLGIKDGAPFWFSGDLLEAETAAARYRELTGIGGYYPKDPALLSWRTPSLLALQVFPVAPRQPKTIEYTLLLPATYGEGRYHVVLPRVGTDALPATATVSGAIPRDALFIDGNRARPGATVRLDKDETDLALAPTAPGLLSGGLATMPLSPDRPDRNLVHVHFEAAPRLSEAPRGARVVVILDASRSLSEADGEAAVAASAAYLSHLPDARVEVLTFDREVRALHGRLVPVKQALATLRGLTLERRNGSRVDDAIARADAILAAQPPGAGPRRIVAITDLLTRASLDPARIQASLRSGALTHIAAIVAATPSLTRDDGGPWAAVARSTGGLLWRGGAAADPDRGTEMAGVFEELARPVRIHHAALTAGGVAAEDLAPLPETFDEGAGYEHFAIHPTAATRVEIAGELWAAPVRLSVTPDDIEAARWSALAFGSHIFHDLREDEMMPLALRGRAVSPVTSYLAIEPGVRPSTEGLDEAIARRFGTGHGSLGGSHRARPVYMSTFDHAAYLHDALLPAWQACGGAGHTATLTIETTAQEVVDIPAAIIDSKGDPVLGPCLTEAAWALALPGAFSSSWSRWTVTI